MEGIGLEKRRGRPREDLLPSVLHFGKIPKTIGQHLAKFSKMQANFAKILQKKFAKGKISKISAMLTKHLRIEDGAKDYVASLFAFRAVFLPSPFR